MDGRARKEERGVVELRKATGLCGAARCGECTYFLRVRARSRPMLVLVTRIWACKRCSTAAAAAASAMHRARAAACARSLARSWDRRCQLAFSNNFHPSKGVRLRPLAPLLFHLSLFLSVCTFTIARSTIAPRRPGVVDRGWGSAATRFARGRPSFVRLLVIKLRGGDCTLYLFLDITVSIGNYLFFLKKN